MKSVCATALVALLVLGQETFAHSQRPPNIVFVLADDYGYRDIGYHGAEFATPTLDKLAASGVKLENYYVQPICSPTRSQLMTGRYQIHTGLQHDIIWPSQPYGLPLQYPTIANVLREEGYSTHAIGKWHLGLFKKEYTPLHRGFDTFYGYWEGGEDYYTYYNCDWTHADDTKAKYCGYDLRDMEKPVTDKNGTYSTLLYTEKAVKLLKERATAQKPFFLYLAYQAVHSPMEVPDSYVKPYESIQNKNRRIYAGMVSALDEGVKNVTEVHKQSGLWENTVLIFSTDNGGEVHAGGNNWPLRGSKHTLWEGGMKGIGFVNSPLLKPQQVGKVSTELMHVSDWFPTIADMVGAKVNTSLDGISQWSMIRDGKPGQREEILHNIDMLFPLKGQKLHNATFDTRVRAAIRFKDFKLITGDPGLGNWYPVPSTNSTTIPFIAPEESSLRSTEQGKKTESKKNLWLFNVSKDPTERNDLSAAMPELVHFLLRRISHFNSTALPPLYPPSDPNCNPQLHGGFWGPWR